MKQCLKFGLLMVSILLFAAITRSAAGAIDAPSAPFSDSCFALHEQDAHWLDFSPSACLYMPCEQGDSKILQMPADRCRLQLYSHSRAYKAVARSLVGYARQRSIPPLFTPVAYYVYGLREIIV